MSSLPLRFVAYAPAEMPCELFRVVTGHVQRTVGWPTALRVEIGNPELATADPFASGIADVGWMCAGWAVPIDALISPAAELAPVAPAFRGVGAAKTFPLRAVVFRRALPRPLARELAQVFAALHLEPSIGRAMRAMGLIRFVPIAVDWPGQASSARRASSRAGETIPVR